MKKCLRCEQVYGDDTNFCLSDGSTLVPVSDSAASYDETPTVYSSAPPPTVYSGAPPPTNFGSAPQFTPQISPAAPPPVKKGNTLLIALAVGFFALVAGGAIVGVVMYALNSSGKKDTNVAVVSNSDDKLNKNASADKKPANDNTAQNLKALQEKLDKDKQKLEEERRKLEDKKLEDKKKEATPTATPPTSSARTAVIIDPPSNIRSAPNGGVQCVARTRGTVVNILGSTGVSDNNGTWYYTDYCGAQGVIHSTQIRF